MKSRMDQRQDCREKSAFHHLLLPSDLRELMINDKEVSLEFKTISDYTNGIKKAFSDTFE